MGSYCQKSCELCPEMEQGQCGGCRSGAYAAQCGIAKCCREKGHSDCGSCNHLSTCVTNRAKSRMPQEIHERRVRDEAQIQRRRERLGVLAAWMPLVFGALLGANILNLVFGLLGLVWQVRKLVIVSTLISAGMMIAAGCGYWALQKADDGFHFVAVVQFLAAVHSVAGIFLPEKGVLTSVLSILMAIFGLMRMRSECMAFRDSLTGIHQELSEKWEAQWSLYLYALLGCLVSVILFFIPLLMVIGLVGSLGMILFLEIRKLVYLYQTMDFARGQMRG